MPKYVPWSEAYGLVYDRMVDLYRYNKLDACIRSCYKILDNDHPRWLRIRTMLMLALCEKDDLVIANLWIDKARACWENNHKVVDDDYMDLEEVYAGLKDDIGTIDFHVNRLPPLTTDMGTLQLSDNRDTKTSVVND